MTHIASSGGKGFAVDAKVKGGEIELGLTMVRIASHKVCGRL